MTQMTQMVTADAIINTPKQINSLWSIIIFVFIMWGLTLAVLLFRIKESKKLKKSIERLKKENGTN